MSFLKEGKQIIVPPILLDGSPTLQVLSPYQGRFLTGRIKTAAKHHPVVQSFLDSFRPGKNDQVVLSQPCGSHEVWGGNSNADTFTRAALSNKIAKHNGRVFGHSTWMQATAFRHHVNKDPRLGWGSVKAAAFCNDMDRCLVLMVHDREKAAAVGAGDIVTSIDDGEYPSISMGCRVPYDRCSICGNLAKTAADYCDDIKLHKGEIQPDGRQALMHNDYPFFFDHSYVLKGAAAEAAVLEKIAAVISGKSAAMMKLLPTQVRMMSNRIARLDAKSPLRGLGKLFQSHKNRLRPPATPKAPKPSLPKLAAAQICSSAAALGIVFTPEEFAQLQVKSAEDAKRLIHPRHVDPNLMDEFAGAIRDRSCFHPVILDRAVKVAQEMPTGQSSYSENDGVYDMYRASVLVKIAGLLDEITPYYGHFYTKNFFKGVAETMFWPEKTATARSQVLSAALAMVPVVYLASSHWRKQSDSGEKLGMLESLVADHPAFTSALLTGAAMSAVGTAGAATP